ncbi:hypothetical protein K461DRAFT_318552 [Myriangium duriaei CBS 260.36]|uniref:Uncharacterized protein n=1 Tax=Myriangium duriaei CBS 260.36 TaxID=1168546 RepID=A0A9P4J9G5_9PEZI|nr:hypothetical protein K461DRAFT_318552 [Myriangium duriaei CBS 260.36]
MADAASPKGPAAPTAPAQPTPPQPSAAEPKSADSTPKSAEPKSANSKPADPVPVKPEPSEPTPAGPSQASEPRPNASDAKPTKPEPEAAAPAQDTKPTEPSKPISAPPLDVDTAAKVSLTTDIKAGKSSPPVATLVEKSNVKAAAEIQPAPPSPMPKVVVLDSPPSSPLEKVVVIPDPQKLVDATKIDPSKPDAAKADSTQPEAPKTVDVVKVELAAPDASKPALAPKVIEIPTVDATKIDTTKPDVTKPDVIKPKPQKPETVVDVATGPVQVEVTVPDTSRATVPKAAETLKVESIKPDTTTSTPSKAEVPQIIQIVMADPNKPDLPTSDLRKIEPPPFVEVTKPDPAEIIVVKSEASSPEVPKIVESVKVDPAKPEFTKADLSTPAATKTVEVLQVQKQSVPKIETANPEAPKIVQIIKEDPSKIVVAKPDFPKPEATKTVVVQQVEKATPSQPEAAKAIEVLQVESMKAPASTTATPEALKGLQVGVVPAASPSTVQIVELKSAPTDVTQHPAQANLIVVEKPKLDAAPVETNTLQRVTQESIKPGLPKPGAESGQAIENTKPDPPTKEVRTKTMKAGSTQVKVAGGDRAIVTLKDALKPTEVTKLQEVPTEPVYAVNTKAPAGQTATEKPVALQPALPPSSATAPSASVASAAAATLDPQVKEIIPQVIEIHTQPVLAEASTLKTGVGQQLIEPKAKEVSPLDNVKPVIVEAKAIPDGPPVVIITEKETATTKTRPTAPHPTTTDTSMVTISSTADLPSSVTKQDIVIAPVIITESKPSASPTNVQVVNTRPVVVAENKTATVITTNVPAIVTATAMSPDGAKVATRADVNTAASVATHTPAPGPKRSFFDLRGLFRHFFTHTHEPVHEDNQAAEEPPRKKH